MEWNWINNNKEWLFSGIAIAIPLGVIGWFISSKRNTQMQRGGKGSINTQVGGNITINGRSDKKDA